MQRKLVSRIVATVVCGLLIAAPSARGVLPNNSGILREGDQTPVLTFCCLRRLSRYPQVQWFDDFGR